MADQPARALSATTSGKSRAQRVPPGRPPRRARDRREGYGTRYREKIRDRWQVPAGDPLRGAITDYEAARALLIAADPILDPVGYAGARRLEAYQRAALAEALRAYCWRRAVPFADLGKLRYRPDARDRADMSRTLLVAPPLMTRPDKSEDAPPAPRGPRVYRIAWEALG